MKKLIALAAVATCGAALAVESANIVGYSSNNHADSQYISVGMGFAGVGDDGVFTLNQLKPTAWDSSSDILQVLSSVNAGTIATYVYYGAWEVGEELAGWYDDEVNPVGDTEFPIGTAFLGNFAAKDVKLQQSGQVLEGATTLDFTGKQYVMFSNILPKAITLGDIAAANGCWDSSSDILQVLSAENAGTIATYIYYGAWEVGDELAGWYDDEVNPVNDVVVAPGAAWLGNFAAKDVKIVFPSAF